jgi:hypothetical protein
VRHRAREHRPEVARLGVRQHSPLARRDVEQNVRRRPTPRRRREVEHRLARVGAHHHRLHRLPRGALEHRPRHRGLRQVLAHDGYPAPDEAGRVSEALALPVHTYDLMLIDLRNKNITGKKAQETLDRAHITLNKNSVPYDDKSPFVTSGIRIGVPAITTRGLNAGHMQTVVDMIDKVLMNADDEQIVSSVKEEVKSFMQQFPLYPELG